MTGFDYFACRERVEADDDPEHGAETAESHKLSLVHGLLLLTNKVRIHLEPEWEVKASLRCPRAGIHPSFR